MSIKEETKRINKLEIRNFKSIKEIDIRPAKVNLFIGEPNTGKSNILEALGIWSALSHGSGNLESFVRFQSFSNLFFEDLIDTTIHIEINSLAANIHHQHQLFSIEMKNYRWDYDYDGNSSGGGGSVLDSNIQNLMRRVRYYKYHRNHQISYGGGSPLNPPTGSNLFSTIFSSKEYRQTLIDFMKPFGLIPVFKPQQKMIEFQATR